MSEKEEGLTPTSAEKIRKENEKLIKCTSGYVYRVRKMPLTVLASFLGLDFATSFTEQMKDPVKARQILAAIDTALPICVVEPKITLVETEGAITMNDIPTFDQIELFIGIITFSGFTDKKMKEFESFREKQARTSSKKSS